MEKDAYIPLSVFCFFKIKLLKTENPWCTFFSWTGGNPDVCSVCCLETFSRRLHLLASSDMKPRGEFTRTVVEKLNILNYFQLFY